MKQILILVFTLWSFNMVIAQDNKRNQKISYGFELRYLKTVDVGVNYLIGPNSDFPGTYGKSLRLNLGYFFNPHIYSGLTFGADRYEVAAANTFPLLVNVRYYLKDARNTLYTFAEGGPNLAFSTASDKGFTSAIGVGYKFFISKKSCFTTSFGYNYEKSKLTGIEATYRGDYLSRKSLLFSIGMLF